MRETEKLGHPGGQLLAHYRQRLRDLSQQDLASLVGCSRSMVAQIEQGTRLPSGQLLSSMSQVLRLNAVERAILFSLYGRVQSDQDSMLPYAVAVLCLDPMLRSDQVESLVRLVVRECDDSPSYVHERGFTQQLLGTYPKKQVRAGSVQAHG